MNQKGFANIILVVVIVAVLVGAVGYFVFVKKSEPITKQPMPTSTSTQTETSTSPTPTPILKDEIANWKIYRNEKFGFQFKYPDSIFLAPTLREKNKYFYFYQISMPYISEFDIISDTKEPKLGQIIKQGLIIRIAEYDARYPNIYENSVETYKKEKDGLSQVFFSGREAFIIDENNQKTVALVKLNDNSFIEFMHMDVVKVVSSEGGVAFLPIEDKKNREVFDKILSTFEFTK